MGGLEGMRLQLDRPLAENDLLFIRHFALTAGVFILRETARGTSLLPLPLEKAYVLPRTLLETRRYKGKTNELMTEFLLNLGWFASHHVRDPKARLRVLDPLSGGGTTLFAALVRGWNAFGVDHNGKVVESTVAYLKTFLRTAHLKHDVRQAKIRGLGRRWVFEISSITPPLTCVIAHGDTGDTFELLANPRAHLLVTDLPYGVQHRGLVMDLFGRGINGWLRCLRKGAVLVFMWDQRTVARGEMIRLLEGAGNLHVLDEPPWNQLMHTVDRVIKRRDILVARYEGKA